MSKNKKEIKKYYTGLKQLIEYNKVALNRLELECCNENEKDIVIINNDLKNMQIYINEFLTE